jgi:hypothetical protein
MLSPSPYQPVHDSQIKAAQSPHPGDFHTTLMWGRSSPNHTLAESGDFSHPHHRRGKNVACEKVGLIGLCFRGTLSSKTINPGEKNGHHTHDTSRSSNDAKSLNFPD